MGRRSTPWGLAKTTKPSVGPGCRIGPPNRDPEWPSRNSEKTQVKFQSCKQGLGKISAEIWGVDPTSDKMAKRTRTCSSLGHARPWSLLRGESRRCKRCRAPRGGSCTCPRLAWALGTLLRTAVPAVCTYVEQPVRVPGPGPHAGLNVGRRPVTQPRVWPESRTGNMGAEEANSSSAGPEPT